MSRFKMDDGTVVDPELASDTWEEHTYFDGRNMISKATGSQWEHETLYRSKKGRYYIVWYSQRQGSGSTARWLDHKEAVSWILLNKGEVPADLADVAADVVE